MKRTFVLGVLWLASASTGFGNLSALAHPRWSKTVTGKVMDDQSNLPIVAALTISVTGFTPVESTSNALGQFSVTIPDATTCTVRVHAEGFDSQEETVEISDAVASYVEIHLTPVVKLTMDGAVYATTPFAETPLDATLKVYLNSDFAMEDSVVVSQGRYSEAFTNFGWYIIDFSAPGFEEVRDTIWVMNNNRKTIHKDYYLVPLESNLITALTSINFNFDDARLNTSSYVELDYLAQFLKHNPDKQVEITGYTDSRGSKEYNLVLSKARVNSVVGYLKAKGVNGDQLRSIANGDRNPIASNATPIGAAKNRRVELVVANKGVNENATVTESKNVHFAFDQTSLDGTSLQELDRLAELSNKNSLARFDICGHTDSTGPEGYNELLSNARARAVVNYLIGKGIDAGRLNAKGYGAKRPIDSNATREGQANNRRVEVIISYQ